MWNTLQENVFSTWLNGGPIMLALAVLALIAYFSILQIVFYNLRLAQLRQDPNEWGHWVDNPTDAEGMLSGIIHYTQEDIHGYADLDARFAILEARLIRPLDRHLKFSHTLVTAAPLLGLLGTVIGMLTTFKGLAVSSGATLDLVAGGISEALITTQTGLVLAIPGLFLINHAQGQRRALQAFIGRLRGLTFARLQTTGVLRPDHPTLAA